MNASATSVSSGSAPAPVDPGPDTTIPSAAQDLATRVAAAAAASAAAVVVVTPLDVIKVSMQAAPAPPHHGHGMPHARLSSMAASSCVDARPSLCLRHLEGSSLSAAASHLNLHHGGSSCSTVARVAAASSSALCPTCSPHALSSLAVAWQPASEVRPTVFSTAANIVRRERVAALWKGLDLGLLLSVPVVSIHIPLYDYLNTRLTDSLGVYSPAVAGMAARAVAVVTTAPLEVLRTRKQAAASPAAPSQQLPPAQHRGPATLLSMPYATRRTPKVSQAQSASHAVGAGLAASLREGQLARRVALALSDKWVGTSATLWRDVPFSGLYWMATEPLRGVLLSWMQQSAAASNASLHALEELHQQHNTPSVTQPTPPPSVGQVLSANFLAGSLAGGLAAALTTPFDVVKTRQQTAALNSRSGAAPGPAGSIRAAMRVLPLLPAYPRVAPESGSSMFAWLLSIYRAQGVGGLYRGVGPRSVRAMLACGTVIAGYEGIKMMAL